MKTVHVAVAVIENPAGEILIAKRPNHLHLGGFWEFPGGKVEKGETVLAALQREIQEELALYIEAAEPLIQIPFVYPETKNNPEKTVLLDVWRVRRFSGAPQSCEGQDFLWINTNDLHLFDFPAANRGIITALQLPARLLITGEFSDNAECVQRTQTAIQKHNIQLVMLRAHALSATNYQKLAEQMRECCHALEAKLLLNAGAECALSGADGLHLSANHLFACTHRPVNHVLLGVSCHNAAELQQAINIGADYVLLSPVQKTATHPSAPTLGWKAFATLAAQSPVPVFALGGLMEKDIINAQKYGAQGIAAISAWW